MEKMKSVHNEVSELKKNESDCSKTYNNFSIKNAVNAIQNSENNNKNNPDNILQKLDDSVDENKLPPAMKLFINTLQKPSYITLSSKN